MSGVCGLPLYGVGPCVGGAWWSPPFCCATVGAANTSKAANAIKVDFIVPPDDHWRPNHLLWAPFFGSRFLGLVFWDSFFGTRPMVINNTLVVQRHSCTRQH